MARTLFFWLSAIAAAKCTQVPRVKKYEIKDDVVDLIIQYKDVFLGTHKKYTVNTFFSILNKQYGYEVEFIKENCFLVINRSRMVCYKLLYSHDSRELNWGEDNMYKLRHRNICHIYENFTLHFFDEKYKSTAHLKVIIMEYLNPLTQLNYEQYRLNATISNRNPLRQQDELQQLLKCITYAICSLQYNDLVHLDIKPDNIVKISSNGYNIYKLIDFQGCQKVSYPKYGFIFFTHGFQSPEFKYYKKIHRNSDIWSLGMLAYVLVTGNVIRENGNTNYDVYHYFISNKNAIIGNLQIDFRIKKFISACLKIDPQMRPSAKTLLDHEYFSNC
ncbi:Serine/threonine-protein kinase 17A [Conglomerata obtusa]